MVIVYDLSFLILILFLSRFEDISVDEHKKMSTRINELEVKPVVGSVDCVATLKVYPDECVN